MDSNLDQKWIKVFTRKLDLRHGVNGAYGWAQKFEATANCNYNNIIIRYSSTSASNIIIIIIQKS